MSRLLPATLCALALIASGCASAREAPPPGKPAASRVPGLELAVDETYYDVAGLTARELNRELSRRGPIHEGTAWQGRTDFRVVYSYVPRREPDGCRAAAPQVTVRLVTTLPRWKDRDEASETLRSDWDLYLSRLRDHEEGHRRIAIGAGQELLADVAALEAADCAALRKSAAAVAANYQSEVDVEQRGWDDLTQHGLAVGN